MKLSFYGAAHEVTGSLFLLEACGKRVIVDCGMEQGRDIYVNQELPIAASDIDMVLLTHAHIDHSGNLPLLYAHGFRGPIYSTAATAKLCNIMLRDSAHIQEFEAEWRNRKAKRAGREPYIPVYTMADALGAIDLFKTSDYGEAFEPLPGFKVRFIDAGHLLGSASIELTVTENGETRTIVFSGDIGNVEQPILRNPSYPEKADFVVMESTYGDRSHGATPDYISALAELIQRTLDRGGNVVIPSFAVGRTQEMLYFIRKIKADGLIRGHDGFPVYVDSPLAIEATHVFQNSAYDCFDAEAMELVRSGINPISFPGLRTSVSADESKQINFDATPKVIISASGMCEAGRIRHHLKHNLWRPESAVLFVGYQAEGTLGRLLLEGQKEIKLFGDAVDVKAEITMLPGVSGHADDKGLIKWASSFKERPKRVFVVHGEDTVCDKFAERLTNELGLTATAPYNGEEWDILADVRLREGVTKPIEREAAQTRRVSAVFERLVAAGKRLVSVISRCEGTPNKELAKFADQVNALCDKWDK